MTDQLVSEPMVAQELGVVLAALSAELMRSSANDMMCLLRREGLSLPRVVALLFVERLGASSISEISDHLNLALGTTSQIVDQLVTAGYVGRNEDPTDRRQKRVRLTEQGQQLVGEVRRVRAEELARRMALLAEPLLTRALATMRELTEALSELPLPVTGDRRHETGDTRPETRDRRPRGSCLD